MSFGTLFHISLDRSEEEIIAALYLIGKKPQGDFFADDIRRKSVETLKRLHELPAPWAKELALNVLQRAKNNAVQSS